MSLAHEKDFAVNASLTIKAAESFLPAILMQKQNVPIIGLSDIL